MQRGIELLPGQRMRDRHTGESMPVNDVEWRLLRRFGAGGAVAESSLDRDEVEAAASLGAEVLEVVAARGAWLRALRRGIVEGRTDELRGLVNAIGVRIELRSDRPLRSLAVCVGWTVRSYWVAVTVAALLSFALAAWTEQGIWGLVAAVLWPVVVCATVAAHEFAHLTALRWVCQDRVLGALWVRPGRVSVIRPRLAGRRLRAVAAAGPLAGLVVAVMLLLFTSSVPWLLVAAVVGIGVHFGNLLPFTPDGAHLWTGADS